MTADPFQALAEAAHGWGLGLAPEQSDLLRRYVSEVRVHAEKMNLTSDKDETALALRHVADGLACLPLLKELSASPNPEILDLGAGAGFIGIAIQAAWPEARVTLMEPRLRRFGFLSTVVARLGLRGMRLVRKRATPGKSAGTFDIVVARALARLDEALAAALPLVRPGGRFVCYQSAEPDPEDARWRDAAARAGAVLERTHNYLLPGEKTPRLLAVFLRKEG